jgi:hypothetical protein
MARPRKNPAQSAQAIEAEIAEEVDQHALLQRDLRDALIAGENTRPYRQALAEIAGKIENLQVRISALRQAEDDRRHVMTAATAEEITAEAVRRHGALLARLDVPAFPKIEGYENVTL